MWLSLLQLFGLSLLAAVTVTALERPKAFGHTIEYRYEYDPIKGKNPIVHWKYDNINGQSKEGILYPNEFHDVRKSPAKYVNKPPYMDMSSEMEPREYRYNKMFRRQEWSDEQPVDNREEAAERTRELTDAMSSILREESKFILAQHFPNFPFAFEPIQRQYDNRYGPPDHNFRYSHMEERPYMRRYD